jgi:hypothetical protein
LVNCISSLWREGHSPRIEYQPRWDYTPGVARNTVWQSLFMVFKIDNTEGLLRIDDIGRLTGPDSPAVRAMLRGLAEVAGLTDSRCGFPVELLEPKKKDVLLELQDRCLPQAIEHLSPLDQAVFRLMAWEGLSGHEVVEQLRIAGGPSDRELEAAIDRVIPYIQPGPTK